MLGQDWRGKGVTAFGHYPEWTRVPGLRGEVKQDTTKVLGILQETRHSPPLPPPLKHFCPAPQADIKPVYSRTCNQTDQYEVNVEEKALMQH